MSLCFGSHTFYFDFLSCWYWVHFCIHSLLLHLGSKSGVIFYSLRCHQCLGCCAELDIGTSYQVALGWSSKDTQSLLLSAE
jgi:hypothetical protein